MQENNTLRFRGLNEETRTAGPGIRLEYFTKGCHRGITSPCEGCFNEDTWSFDGLFKAFTVDELVDNILFKATTKNVTFCGGEPILQGKLLVEVVKKVKAIDPDFHFVLYTSYDYEQLLKNKRLSVKTNTSKHSSNTIETIREYSHNTQVVSIVSRDGKESISYLHNILNKKDLITILDVFDLVVDGDYRHELRLTNHETMHTGGFIGSSNQKVIYDYDAKKNELLYYPSALYPYVEGVLEKDQLFCKYCLTATTNHITELCTSCEKEKDKHE